MKTIAELLDSFSSQLPENDGEIEKLLKEYPASSWIKIIGLKKYRDQNNPEFETLKANSGIYFNNSVWYSYILSTIEREAHINSEPENSNPLEAIAASGETADIVSNTPENVASEEKVQELIETSADNNSDENEIEVPDAETEKSETSSLGNDAPGVAPTNESGSEKDQENTIEESAIEGNKMVNEEIKIEEIDAEKDDNTQDPIVPIEPLHTVDYFASQGIRLTEMDLKDDNLSQQVKSFTGWLKHMKKIHPTRLLDNPNINEQIVREEAEKSNVNLEVYTEAMAEVLIKQNKTDKAIEMYQKLSLMNPVKSAYFAAKIENLKTT